VKSSRYLHGLLGQTHRTSATQYHPKSAIHMAMSPRLLRPRATGFSPKTISGLGLWLDAADTSSLTFNGNTVSEWRDLSGNARNFTQGTAANQPSGAVTTQNGRRVLSFEHVLGTASRLNGNSASLSIARNVGGLTVFGVAKSDLNDTLRPIIAASVGTGTGARASIGTAFTAPNNFTVGNRRLDADSSQAATAGSNNTNANVFGGVLDYANAAAYLHLNGATVATNTSFQTAGNTSDTNSQAVKIGSDAGDVFNWRGWIGEIIIYQRALTAAERQRVERHLGRKWGITVA